MYLIYVSIYKYVRTSLSIGIGSDTECQNVNSHVSEMPQASPSKRGPVHNHLHGNELTLHVNEI